MTVVSSTGLFEFGLLRRTAGGRGTPAREAVLGAPRGLAEEVGAAVGTATTGTTTAHNCHVNEEPKQTRLSKEQQEEIKLSIYTVCVCVRTSNI